MKPSTWRISFALAWVALLLAGCMSSISPFSEVAYQQATSLKAQALVLMDQATEPYAEHRSEVAALKVKLHEADEYAAGRPKNEDSTEQW